MTREQFKEADECVSLLNKCREHLDNVMYNGPEITNSELIKLRRIYDKICSALDEW